MTSIFAAAALDEMGFAHVFDAWGMSSYECGAPRKWERRIST